MSSSSSSGRQRRRRAIVFCFCAVLFVSFLFSALFSSRDDVFHGDDDFAGKSSSSTSVDDDALNEDDATRMMQKKQQQLLIHGANNRHARSSTVSSSIVLEKTEEYAEKIEDVLEPYYRQVFGKFAQMSGFGASAGEEEQEALKKKEEEDLDEVDMGTPLIEDDALEQENQDLERVNTEEEDGTEPIPAESVKIKYKDKEKRETCEREDVAIRTKSLNRNERNRIQQIKPRKFWVARDEAANGRKYSHMATIGRWNVNATKKGFAVAWQSSSGIEGIRGQSILISYAEDVDQPWSKPKRVSSMQNVKTAVWSPVLFNPPNEENGLWLFYTESQNCLRPARENKSGSKIPPRFSPGGDVKVTKSRDGGKTWSEPQEVHAQSKEDSPGMPKVIANRITVHTQTGNWVLPYWKEKAESNACRQPKSPASHGVLVSKDQGKSWQPKGKIRVGGTWLIEGAVVERRDYSLQLFFRTSKGKVYTAFSWDGGDTWTGANPTTVPNPDSKMDATSFPDTREIVVAFNDATDKNKINKGRCRLRVSISCDGGVGFKTITELEEGSLKMYIHYPTVITDGDRAIVAYSLMGHPHLRQGDIGGIKIAEVKFNPKSFERKKYEPKVQQVEEEKISSSLSSSSTSSGEGGRVEEGDIAVKTTLSYELDGL